MSNLVDSLVFMLMNVLLFLGRLLPDFCIYSFGWLVGELYYKLYPKKRELTYYNLQKALAPQEVTPALVRKNFQRIGIIAAEFLLLPSWSPAKIERRVTIHGREYLEEALSKGKGAILGGGHLGNWELMLVALSNAGFPCHSIVTKQSLSKTNDLIFSLRRRMGLGLIKKTGFSLRETYKVLKSNSVLLVMMDQYGGENGLDVEFFGSKTSTSKGAASLAQRTGAPILPVTIRFKKQGHYDLVLKPPLLVEGREIQDILRDLNMHLEEEIRLAPTEWLSPIRRWRKPAERVTLNA